MKVVVDLATPATELAREEIPKAVGFLAPGIRHVRFEADGARLVFEAPDDAPASLADDAAEVARGLQRSLRTLARKVAFRSRAFERPTDHGPPHDAGVRSLGRGQVALEGVALRLYRYFDRTLAALGEPFAPTPLLTPTLVATDVLARCGYLSSFPHLLTVAGHLPDGREELERFRERRSLGGDTLDDEAFAPAACLSPAVCYHCYALNQDRTLPAGGLAYAVVGRCFRRESGELCDLRRLWEFTMREVVLLGRRDHVLARRDEALATVAAYLDDHGLAGEIRTASDPFFVGPEGNAQTYFQLGAETKLEISLLLSDGERLAVGSLNDHGDFFGRAFRCDVDGAGPMHSVCVAFGLERWVHAFLVQHGADPSGWPAQVRASS